MPSRITLILGLLLCAGTAGGQSPPSGGGRLTGTVRDGESKAPLENVNIYIANTTRGSSTDTAGFFSLGQAPPGLLELIVSRIGYERASVSVRHFRPDSLHLEILLTPAVVQVPGIDVDASPPGDWKSHMELFRKSFIGEGEMADRCTLLNPEALRFTLRGDTLWAASDSVLRMHNAALGYDLFMVLQEFAWDTRQDCGRYRVAARFVPLVPGTGDEEYEWSRRRADVFEGSLRHFLRTLYTGTGTDEPFYIESGSLEQLRTGRAHVVRLEDIAVVRDPSFPVVEVHFPGYLRVHYGVRPADGAMAEERRDRFGRPLAATSSTEVGDASLILLKTPAVVIDSLGNLLDPLSVEVSGIWARYRAWMLLPTDFQAKITSEDVLK